MQAAGPHNVCHIGPNAARLVGEHNHLQTIVRHAFRHAPIRRDHAAPKVIIFTLDGE